MQEAKVARGGFSGSVHGLEGLVGKRQVRGQVGEDGAGDALHVLCARNEDRAMILKGRRNTIRRFGSEEVVYGQRVDLAAVGAAVFDFGDSHGLVAAVGELNALSIVLRYERQRVLEGPFISWFIYRGPRNFFQYRIFTHPRLPRSKGNLDFSSSLEA